MTRTWAAHRAIDRLGRDVTLQNYSKTGEDDYGEDWSADSPQTIKARVAKASGFPLVETDRRMIEQGEVNTPTEVYIKDSVTGIRDGGGEGASEIEVDGETLVVLQIDDNDRGVIRLICERED